MSFIYCSLGVVVSIIIVIKVLVDSDNDEFKSEDFILLFFLALSLFNLSSHQKDIDLIATKEKLITIEDVKIIDVVEYKDSQSNNFVILKNGNKMIFKSDMDSADNRRLKSLLEKDTDHESNYTIQVNPEEKTLINYGSNYK